MSFFNTNKYAIDYELVSTVKQQKEFENIWGYMCAKNGWLNDPYASNGVRYNLIQRTKWGLKRKRVIGTIEFIPYHPENPNSTVEGPNRYQFSRLDEIKLNHQHIWEIDKLCIHEEYQRRGIFPIFMKVFYDHCSKYNPKYYLALIEKKLFRMLKISFSLAVEQKGDDIIGPNTALIPMIFDVEKMMKDKNKVDSLLSLRS
ncbi:hypothetical protein [Metabacillus litoralis]|uniref:hypothetical protein n=1 Tax=Metabacillus litoralis TaxID=152268 RepID=UPI001CFE338E|nr:hypothetical protein [Metabacillus litoralis]